jgi:hypothetical protein
LVLLSRVGQSHCPEQVQRYASESSRRSYSLSQGGDNRYLIKPAHRCRPGEANHLVDKLEQFGVARRSRESLAFIALLELTQAELGRLNQRQLPAL